MLRPRVTFLAWAFSVGVLAASNVSWAIGGEAEQAKPAPLPPLTLTLRGALTAALNNNPDVQLYKERIQAAQGQVQTQLGALLPNLSSNVKQSRQTIFQGTFGLAPIRTDPFSIFDARVNGSQNVISVSLIQRWRASRVRRQAVRHDGLCGACIHGRAQGDGHGENAGVESADHE